MKATHRVKTGGGVVLGYQNQWDERWYSWPEHAHIKSGHIQDLQPLAKGAKVRVMKGVNK